MDCCLTLTEPHRPVTPLCSQSPAAHERPVQSKADCESLLCHHRQLVTSVIHILNFLELLVVVNGGFSIATEHDFPTVQSKTLSTISETDGRRNRLAFTSGCDTVTEREPKSANLIIGSRKGGCDLMCRNQRSHYDEYSHLRKR